MMMTTSLTWLEVNGFIACHNLTWPQGWEWYDEKEREGIKFKSRKQAIVVLQKLADSPRGRQILQDWIKGFQIREEARQREKAAQWQRTQEAARRWEEEKRANPIFVNYANQQRLEQEWQDAIARGESPKNPLNLSPEELKIRQDAIAKMIESCRNSSKTRNKILLEHPANPVRLPASSFSRLTPVPPSSSSGDSKTAPTREDARKGRHLLHKLLVGGGREGILPGRP